MTAPDDVVEVRLLQVPVAVWARSREHSEALQREFALVAQDADGVPARLLQLLTAVRGRYAAQTSAQEEALEDAAAAGRPELDLLYRVPTAVGAAARDVARMFDEADAHCRAGEHLLTLAADEDVVRFRWWFLDQFHDQVAGRPPVAWPEHRRT